MQNETDKRSTAPVVGRSQFYLKEKTDGRYNNQENQRTCALQLSLKCTFTLHL